jgi:transposase
MTLLQAQRIALFEAYFECKSYERCVEIFRRRFPNSPTPCKDTVYELVKRFRDTGRVQDRPRSGRPPVVTPDFAEEVNRRLLQSPRKGGSTPKTRNMQRVTADLRTAYFKLTA